MRIALVNPCWSYSGSIYFGCQDPHLPLQPRILGAQHGRLGVAVDRRPHHLDAVTIPALWSRGQAEACNTKSG